MTLKPTLLAALLAASSAGAHASLVFEGAQEMKGTGLGHVNTILTIQGHDKSEVETGAVGVGAGNQMVIGGDAKTGASQTQLLTFGDVGITDVGNLRVVFNADEPGNDKNGIGLDNMVLSFYDPAGTMVFSSGPFAPQSFADTYNGIGKAGFVFRLDDAQTAAARAALGSSFGDFRIGLDATASHASGGPDTFFIMNAAAPVPEPSEYALLLAGLTAIGFVVKRRQVR